MLPDALFSIMEVAAVSPGAPLVLGLVAGMLAVATLVVVALRYRRGHGRQRNHPTRRMDRADITAPLELPRPPDVSMSAPGPRAASDMGGGGMGMAAASPLAMSDVKACPSCRCELDAALTLCPHDTRRLVPASQMLARAPSRGRACLVCGRAYEPETFVCPHDDSTLVPMSIYEATRGEDLAREPTGVMAKVCPQCQRPHDYAARFCGRDGTELVIVH